MPSSPPAPTLERAAEMTRKPARPTGGGFNRGAEGTAVLTSCPLAGYRAQVNARLKVVRTYAIPVGGTLAPEWDGLAHSLNI